jgi:hypothetical protein
MVTLTSPLPCNTAARITYNKHCTYNSSITLYCFISVLHWSDSTSTDPRYSRDCHWNTVCFTKSDLTQVGLLCKSIVLHVEHAAQWWTLDRGVWVRFLAPTICRSLGQALQVWIFIVSGHPAGHPAVMGTRCTDSRLDRQLLAACSAKPLPFGKGKVCCIVHPRNI